MLKKLNIHCYLGQGRHGEAAGKIRITEKFPFQLSGLIVELLQIGDCQRIKLKKLNIIRYLGQGRHGEAAGKIRITEKFPFQLLRLIVEL